MVEPFVEVFGVVRGKVAISAKFRSRFFNVSRWDEVGRRLETVASKAPNVDDETWDHLKWRPPPMFD